MSKCCYLCLCHNLSRNKSTKCIERSKITLHKFPNDSETRGAWLKICGLSEEVDDVSGIKICSAHFKRDDYVEPNAKLRGGRLVLKAGVIPSISIPRQPTSDTSISPTKEILFVSCEEEVSVETEETCMSPSTEVDRLTLNEPPVIEPHYESHNVITIDTPTKRKFAEPRYISEIEATDFTTPEGAHKVLSLVRRIDKDRCQKMKKLRDRNRYLKQRISSFKELIRRLTNTGLINEKAKKALMAHVNLRITEEI